VKYAGSGQRSVGIETGFGLDDLDSIPGRGKSTGSRPALEPILPPIQWILWASSLGVKRLGSEADHSPLSSAEVELYLTPLRLHGIVLN
jgi:hypothetical protein